MRYVFAMRTYKLLRAAAASKAVAAADVGERVQIKRPLHGCVAAFFNLGTGKDIGVGLCPLWRQA